MEGQPQDDRTVALRLPVFLRTVLAVVDEPLLPAALHPAVKRPKSLYRDPLPSLLLHIIEKCSDI